MADDKMPAIVRPNGKVYRPRKLTAGTWENDYRDDDWSGCFVHDSVRGRAAVRFVASDDPEEVSG